MGAGAAGISAQRGADVQSPLHFDVASLYNVPHTFQAGGTAVIEPEEAEPRPATSVYLVVYAG
jgi:hypothetical protein